MSKVRNKNKRYAKCQGCACKGAPTTGGGGRKASFDNNRSPQTSGSMKASAGEKSEQNMDFSGNTFSELVRQFAWRGTEPQKQL